MAEKSGGPFEGQTENEVWGAIAAFEQILEVAPDDTGALDALSQAYDLIGDGERGRHYLLRLSRLYIAQKNAAAAAELIPRLERYGAADEEAASLIRDIRHLVPIGPPTAEPEKEAAIPQRCEGFTLDAELALAWRLQTAGLLTPEDYSQVVSDLSDMAARQELLTISLLHVLHDRGFRNLDNVMAFMARESGTPMIRVTSFETIENCQTLLPLEFMVRQGVVPFATIAQEALIAVLNPFDEGLRERVARKTGRTCHFYLTWPADFDAWIARLNKTQSSPP